MGKDLKASRANHLRLARARARRQDNSQAYDFGFRLMGPAVVDYLARLHGVASYFEEEPRGRVLFVSRAGVRIGRAFDAFVKRTGLPALKNSEMFWISRLMVAKGAWRRSREKTLELLTAEFAHASLRVMIAALLRHDRRLAKLDLGDPSLGRSVSAVALFLAEGGPAAKALEAHLDQQSELFEDYLAQVMKGRSSALLVDTGWQGTAQALLSHAFPKINWWGAYFGRFHVDRPQLDHWDRMIGLVVDREGWDPKRPESCVYLARHFIESLFEPTGESIELLRRKRGSKIIVAPQAAANLADKPTRQTDPIFAGVLDYIDQLDERPTPGAWAAAATEAWEAIAKVAVFPTAAETRSFSGSARSMDFGRAKKVPLLLPVSARGPDDSADRRIADSIWAPGQVALEYPPEIAILYQKKLAAADSVAPPLPVPASVSQGRYPAVAVITRTLDRPIFLRRALHSVAEQTFGDYVHVIINDGGDIEQARETIATSDCDPSKVVLIDNMINRGMEAASNIGIGHVESDFIVIHDDDDTWEPMFLERTLGYLNSSVGEKYGGVITKCTYVSESFTPNGIVIHDRSPYNDWVTSVHITQMAIGNFFAPIAFVFRRSMYKKVGGYDEALPVLGDWDFNIRFLMESNIAVLPGYLANYHLRDRSDGVLFGNSLLAARDSHKEFAAVVRNNLIRKLNAMGSPAGASIVGIGLHLGEIVDSMRNVTGSTKAVAPMAAPAPASSGPLASDLFWVSSQRIAQMAEAKDVDTLRVVGTVLSDGANTPTDLAQMSNLTAARLAALHDGPYQRLAPPDDFDESSYLMNNPDVAGAIARGELSSGFDHYFYYGQYEGRRRPRK